MQSAWDRRLILDGAHKLASSAEYRHTVFIRPDQSLAGRRQAVLRRLKERVVKEGKSAVERDGCLFVDGVTVFSVSDGYVKRNDSSIGMSATSAM